MLFVSDLVQHLLQAWEQEILLVNIIKWLLLRESNIKILENV